MQVLVITAEGATALTTWASRRNRRPMMRDGGSGAGMLVGSAQAVGPSV